VSHFLRALPDLARVGFAGVVAYRAEMIIWILSATLPLVMLALWNAVASEGPVAGLDQEEIARYFAATLLVRQLTSVWLVWELNEEIRTGRLSSKLLKPMHPLAQHAVDMAVALPLRAAVLAPMLAALLVWRPELWRTPSLMEAGLFLVAVGCAWALNFLIQALFGILSFWIDKSDGLFGVWFGLYALLSGYLAPLDTYPEPIRAVLALLPFKGMLGTPVEVLSGLRGPAEAAAQVGVSLAWVALLGLAVALGWSAGLRRYGAHGA
jgi:ABC-2 type transport system permease protein